MIPPTIYTIQKLHKHVATQNALIVFKIKKRPFGRPASLMVMQKNQKKNKGYRLAFVTIYHIVLNLSTIIHKINKPLSCANSQEV